jgi:hypothetical protein
MYWIGNDESKTTERYFTVCTQFLHVLLRIMVDGDEGLYLLSLYNGKRGSCIKKDLTNNYSNLPNIQPPFQFTHAKK